jgi:hypothetical protein
MRPFFLARLFSACLERVEESKSMAQKQTSAAKRRSFCSGGGTTKEAAESSSMAEEAHRRHARTHFQRLGGRTGAGCGKIEIATSAPKGAVEIERLTASLKRCPDTKREFFRRL